MKTTECTGGSQPSAWRTHDGRLWFRTLRACGRGSRAAQPAAGPPPATIERVSWTAGAGRPDRPAAPLRERTHRAPLQHDQPSQPQTDQFRFRLVGFDTTWGSRAPVAPRTTQICRPAATRSRSPRAATTARGARHVAALPFSVEPRFYQTAWFLGVCGLAVVLVGLGGHRLRVRQIAARNAALERAGRRAHPAARGGQRAARRAHPRTRGGKPAARAALDRRQPHRSRQPQAVRPRPRRGVAEVCAHRPSPGAR